MAILNVIGERVRKAREKLGLTQDQVAATCQRRYWDVSRVTLAKIETGVRAVNDGEIVVLAAVLKCTPGDLLNGVEIHQATKVVRKAKSHEG